jgi:hypothetical protein
MWASRQWVANMRLLLVSALVVLLAGCQCFTRITASGSLEQGVVFHAPKSAGPYVGGAALLSLAVYAVGGDDSKPLWHLKGRSRTEALRYGVAPVGMNQDAPAAQLERDRTYVVVVEGSPGGVMPGLPCRGKVSFAIGPDGTITSCYEEESACG